MIKIFSRSLKEKELKELTEIKSGSWIYVESPNNEEIEKLEMELNLDIGLLNDALDPFEVPRLEMEDDIPYIFTRTPFADSSNLNSTPILFIMCKNCLVTVTQKKLPLFDKFLENKVEFSTTQKIKFFIQIFSEINASYGSSLVKINKNIYSASSNIEKISNKEIVEFVNYEHITNDFLSRLVQNNTILNTLLSGKTIHLYEEDRDMIEDLFLFNGQLIETSKNSLQSVKNIRDSYSTILTNNLNRTIKLLTSLTIILNVPTMIAGFWGMNIRVPFSEVNSAFAIVAGITIAICLVLFYVFDKNDWL